MIGLTNDTPLLVAALALTVLWIVFWIIERRVADRFRAVARLARTLVLPCFAALWLFDLVFDHIWGLLCCGHLPLLSMIRTF